MTGPDQLTIHTVAEDGVIRVRVAGEIDINSCGQLQETLAGSAGRSVELDLTEVGFIDSSGLRSIIAGQRLITEGGGSLRITALSTPARRLLEITGLLELFQVS